MSRKRERRTLQPVVGQVCPFRFTRADEPDLIPWLTAKQLPEGAWSAFVRRLLREEMKREQAGGNAGDRTVINELVHQIAELRRDFTRGTVLDPSSLHQLAHQIATQLQAGGLHTPAGRDLSFVPEESTLAPLHDLAEGVDDLELD